MNCPQCSFDNPAGFKFCGNCGYQVEEASSPPPPTVSPSLPPEPPAQRAPVLQRDERRDVTVMFADVSGFTAMSEKLDPEEVHTIMNEVFEGLGAAICEEDGFIDKYIGDNVMALYGAPVAHEDNTHRACRAALAMQVFLREFSESHKARIGVVLRMRIGIHCGLVLAGNVGSDFRKDYSVMGDTVNLASRMESNAPPGGILVSGEGVRRVCRQFHFGPVQFLKVKGKDKPVEARTLESEITEDHRIACDPISAPLIGRARELQQLQEILKDASASAPWVEINGEMGTGKSRLVAEAFAHIPGLQCLSMVPSHQTRQQPFGMLQLLVRALTHEVLGSESPLEQREMFKELTVRLGEEMLIFEDALWYLYAPRKLKVPPPDPDPETFRSTLEEGVTLLMERFAQYRPRHVLFIDSFERADDASTEFMERRIRGSAGRRQILIVATRESRTPEHRHQIVLKRLSEEAADRLLSCFVQSARLPEVLRNDLLKRANGIPQFLQELVHSLVRDGILRTDNEGGAWTCDPKAKTTALPSSLFNAHLSRLDRLEETRRDLLRQFSVQGVEFDVGIAEAIREKPQWAGPVVHSLLPELESEGWIMAATGFDPADSQWAFHQPLMCEAGYQTLLLRERRELHDLIAEALLESSGGLMAVAAEQLAHHYEHAEKWEAAAEANLHAGDRAGEIFLNEAALDRYRQVEEMLNRIEGLGDQCLHIKIAARCRSATLLLRMGEYQKATVQAKAMREISRRATDQAEAERLVASACTKRGNSQEAEQLLLGVLEIQREDQFTSSIKISILYDLAELNCLAGKLDQGEQYLNRLRDLLPEGDELSAIRADLMDGKIKHARGLFDPSVKLYSRAHAAAKKIASLSDLAQTSNQMGNVRRDQGDYLAAEKHFQTALKIWNQIGMTECIAGARINLGNLAMSRGNFQESPHHHQQALSAFKKIGNVRGMTLAQINLAIAAIENEEGGKAVAFAREAIATLGDSGNTILLGQSLVILGESHLAHGNALDAQKIFEKILREYEDTTHLLACAGARRGLGRVCLMQDALAEALTHLQQALDHYEHLNREQEAARTLLYLAQAFQENGDHEEALQKLSQAQQRFKSLGAKADVQRTESLMKKISSQS